MSVTFRNVSRRFAARGGGAPVLALDSIDLDIATGEFVVLLGPSGCGKTTMLKMLGGFDVPSTGEVQLDGAAIREPGPDRGTIFQAPTLFPWLCVLDNVLYGPRCRGKIGEPERRRAAELLRAVGLSGFEGFQPLQLSGGMQQRVAIARVLMNDPRVILADEPFAALDEYTRRAMQELFVKAISGGERAMLFVTHSVEEAVYLADRIVIMTPRPGRIRAILEVGMPRPRDRASRPFLDMMSQVFGLIRDDEIDESEEARKQVA
ncbi:MAG: sulfonate transporter ATP-binding protein [Rubritepida sp.]|nr:sulfonate transporter ATP-binding protein [Rubritepida sp.]